MLHNLGKAISQRQSSRSRPLPKLLEIVAFAMIGLHGWLLVFKIPHTLRALFEAFRPGGHGIADADFWAFGRVDAGFRPWYNKLARDLHTQGRFGFAWDDGLGMPLGMRVYNNLATYKLLYWLGTRRMMAIGYLLMVVTSALLCGWRFNLWAGVVVGVLVAGSPLIVASYTHLGKPEVFWWGVAIPFVVDAFSGSGLFAGLLWSFLAWVNLPVSVMLAVVLSPGLFVHSLLANSLLRLGIGAMPGVAKHGLRGIHALRSGILTSFVSEQARLWKRPWYPTLGELVWWLPFTLSIAASAYTARQFVAGGLILIIGIGLHWANHRIIYMNDPQSFHLAFWVIGLGYAVATRSLIGLLAILLLAYNSPRICGVPAAVDIFTDASPWLRHLRNAWPQIKAYPAVAPLRFPQPAPLVAFFNQIPDGARVLAESDGDPRTDSQFRAFWQWTEEFLPSRQVDLANEVHTRVVEANLADHYLVRFNAEQMTAKEMGRLCQMLGVSYVVAHTSATVELLQTIGYQPVAQVDLSTLEHFWKVVRTPPVSLTLLRHPSPVTVIEPAVRWERTGNVLTWKARAGQSYIVRYRYNPDFRAYQNGETLGVEPMHPINGLSLTFMRVKAVTDGPIVLKFHPRWI